MSEKSFDSVGTGASVGSRRPRRDTPASSGNLHVALVAEVRAQAKCAASAHGTVFVGESDGPVRAYNANDGVSRLFIDRDRDKSVNCLAVVNGSDLWVGGAAGDLSVYSLRSPVDGRLVKHGHPKTRPVLAHDKGVWTIANVRDRFVVTGGADFQVRVWNVDGSPRAASHHHSGAVKCVLDFPPTDTLPPAVWTGALDGRVFAWDDPDDDGRIRENDGMFLPGPSKAGVTAMCAHPDGHEAWVGYDDGRVRVFARQNGFVKNDAQMHSKAVSCLVPMGDHVWSGSGDHLVVAWDAKTKACAFILPDQGGFVRAATRVGWAAWIMTSKAIKVWAASSDARDARRRLRDAAEGADEAAEAFGEMEKEQERLRETLRMERERAASDAERGKRDAERVESERAAAADRAVAAEERLKTETRASEKRERDLANRLEKLALERAESDRDAEARELAARETLDAKEKARSDAATRHREKLEALAKEKREAVEEARRRGNDAVEEANARAKKERERLREELRLAEEASARATAETRAAGDAVADALRADAAKARAAFEARERKLSNARETASAEFRRELEEVKAAAAEAAKRPPRTRAPPRTRSPPSRRRDRRRNATPRLNRTNSRRRARRRRRRRRRRGKTRRI